VGILQKLADIRYPILTIKDQEHTSSNQKSVNAGPSRSKHSEYHTLIWQLL